MCFYSNRSLHFGNGGDFNHLPNVSLCGGTNSYCRVYNRMSVLFVIVSVLLERQIERQIETDRQANRQRLTDRQRQTDSDRQTDRDRQRDRQL